MSSDKLGRILLVDDDRATRVFFQTTMQRAGLPFDVCASAGEARRRILENGICVVVVDIHMPDEDGLALAQWIAEKAPYLPIIFLTGDHSKADEQMAYTVVTKPYDSRGFVDLLRDTMFQVRTERRFSSQDAAFKTMASDITAIRDKLNPSGIFERYINDKFLLALFGVITFFAGLYAKKVIG